ncbi:MAG: hypothetical protein LBQ62_00130 [Candidatus Accumulibacter sp.]|nr:hypothetical protein [Accumulibacter sp.]
MTEDRGQRTVNYRRCAPPDGLSWSSIPGRRVDSARRAGYLSKTDAIDAR